MEQVGVKQVQALPASQPSGCIVWHAHSASLARLPPHHRPRSTRRHQPVLRELVLEMLQALLPVALGRSNDGILVLEGRQLAKLFDALAAQGKGLSVREVAQLLVDPAAV